MRVVESSVYMVLQKVPICEAQAVVSIVFTNNLTTSDFASVRGSARPENGQDPDRAGPWSMFFCKH